MTLARDTHVLRVSLPHSPLKGSFVVSEVFLKNFSEKNLEITSILGTPPFSVRCWVLLGWRI